MEHVPFIALKLLMTLLTLPTALPGFWWIIEVLHVETHWRCSTEYVFVTSVVEWGSEHYRMIESSTPMKRRVLAVALRRPTLFLALKFQC